MRTLQRIISGSMAIATTFFCPFVSNGQPTTSTVVSPATAQQDFKAVTSKLDFGGTSLSYSNYHGAVDTLYAVLEPVLQVHQQARGFGLMAKAALLKLGLNDLAIGSSVLPMADGREVRKAYVRAVGRPGILGLWGSTGQPLQGLEHIPANAIAAWGGRIEFSKILPTINSMAEGAIGPNGPQMIKDLVEKANKALAVDINQVLSSLGNEYEFHLIHKENSSGKLVPVVTVRLAVKNDTPYETARKLIDEAAKVEAVADEGGMKLVKILFGSGESAKLYYMANQPGWLVVSTSVEEVKKTAELAPEDRLRNSESFKTSAPGLPTQIDGLSYATAAYTDESMKDMLTNLDKAESAISTDDEDGDSSDEVFKAALKRVPDVVEKMGLLAPYTGWRVNEPDGILFTEVGKPRHGPSATMAATGGVLIAIAVPAFLRARENARGRACQENLSILDGAKEQYALENKKQNGDPVTMEDLKPYLKKAPECPAGGEYKLNPIGTDPVCSIWKDVQGVTVPHKLEKD